MSTNILRDFVGTYVIPEKLKIPVYTKDGANNVFLYAGQRCLSGRLRCNMTRDLEYGSMARLLAILKENMLIARGIITSDGFGYGYRPGVYGAISMFPPVNEDFSQSCGHYAFKRRLKHDQRFYIIGINSYELNGSLLSPGTDNKRSIKSLGKYFEMLNINHEISTLKVIKEI